MCTNFLDTQKMLWMSKPFLHIIKKIGRIYGRTQIQSVTRLNNWTSRQWQDLYETNPRIYFYLAGELQQDEIGERVGILARSAKPAYHSIVELNDADFSEWQQSDLSLLVEIAETYQTLVEPLPLPNSEDTPWYEELFATYQVSALRAQHALLHALQPCSACSSSCSTAMLR